MKRTREKTEQQDEEEVRSQLFDSEVQKVKKILVQGNAREADFHFIPI